MVKHHERFSIRRFILQVVIQLLVLCAVFNFLWPDFTARQFQAGLGPFILVFLSIHLFLCFFEWAFHRYVLHCTVVPWLAHFSKSHRTHHGLTPIKLQPASPGSDRYVLNRYPILEEEQFEASAFPGYALLVFWALFTPLFLAVQLVMPHAPILLGGYVAVAVSMTGYEVFHAVEHYSYEWWQHAVEAKPNASSWQKFQARWWKRLYSFHHFHHANISANEAISGFFGFPVADWAFHTFHLPKDLLLEGRVATAKDFAVQKPWPFVRWLDDWARKREAKIVHRSP